MSILLNIEASEFKLIVCDSEAFLFQLSFCILIKVYLVRYITKIEKKFSIFLNASVSIC